MRKSPQTHVRTATPSTVRNVNRAIVLNLIRLSQPISRAGLAQQTGISRSNISRIVDELIERGVVSEQRADPTGRGRVPIQLRLRDESFRVLGISVRPMFTSIIHAGLSGQIAQVTRFRTPASPERFVQAVVKELGTEGWRGIQQIGVSIPGLIDNAAGEILWLPALSRYAGFNLKTALEEATGVATAVDNDCNLGALADLWLNEAEIAALRDFVFLEIGDVGVGAGIILNRELYRGNDGRFSAEFGHMIVDPAGPRCHCGRRGCWELYVCDRATVKRYAPRAPFSPRSMDELLIAAERRDPAALDALKETAKLLSLGISNIVLALNPQRVVLAGKITKAWKSLAPYITGKCAPARIPIPVHVLEMPVDDLFERGAVTLALSSSFAKPTVGW